MHPQRSLCLLALATAACGSSTTGGSHEPTPTPATTADTSELFVRRNPGAGLDVVAVNLTTGGAASIAGELPGTADASLSIASVTRAGHRVLVKLERDDHAFFATYAFDEALHSWRQLLEGTWGAVTSEDLGIIAASEYELGKSTSRGVKLMTYEGRVLFEENRAGADDRYPRLVALSPTGEWFAMRSGSATVDVRTIDRSGTADPTIGSPAKLGRPEADDSYAATVRCALPTTLVTFADDSSKVAWLDASLAPVATAAFDENAVLPTDASPWSRCTYLATPSNDVYAFADRTLEKVASLGADIRFYDLIAMDKGAYVLRKDAGALEMRTTDATLGTYTPLMTERAAPAGAGARYKTYPSIVARSLTTATKSLVLSVNHSVDGGDYDSRYELDEELFVVSPSGAKTVRLRALPSTQLGSAPKPPSVTYRIVGDGTRLVYVAEGRVHVRALDGDPEKDVLLPGTNYENASVGSPK